MNQWEQFSIFKQQAGHAEIYIIPINTSNQIAFQVSVLMIEYLVATSYELWIM